MTMSINDWHMVRATKEFYVQVYRKTTALALWSMLVNVILVIMIGYCYFTEPEIHYYSSSGVTPPEPLTAMTQANNTDVPLLASGSEIEEAPKLMPE